VAHAAGMIRASTGLRLSSVSSNDTKAPSQKKGQR
jgi:hypothetical protein